VAVMQIQEQYNIEYFNSRKFVDDKTTPGEADFLENVLPLKPPARILDLCCGYGRHCFELASRGYEVIGIDLSYELLLIAERIRSTRNLEQVRFIQGSMCDLPLLIGEQLFDAVICMDCSFGILSDEGNAKTLLNINRSLKRNGLLFLQVGNREYFLNRPEKENRIRKGNKEYISRVWIDNMSKRMFGEWFIFEHGKKIHEVVDRDQGCRLYTCSELKKLLRDTGFEVHSIYCDFSEGSFKSNSQQMLVASQKKAKQQTTGEISSI